ncbi:hypothetical protein HMI54_005513, partial [Coelomomyces lativittatus]
VSFFGWLEKHITSGGQLDELQASEKLAEFRKRNISVQVSRRFRASAPTARSIITRPANLPPPSAPTAPTSATLAANTGKLHINK